MATRRLRGMFIVSLAVLYSLQVALGLGALDQATG